MERQSELEGLEFTARKIKWFDEDLKKMEKMTTEERLEYKSLLKQKGQYTYENP